MSLRHSAALATLVVLVLAGCTTPTPVTPPASPSDPTVPVMPKPTPQETTPAPVAPVDARPATLKGSEESSALLDNFTTFVRALDGQPLAAGRQGWNEAVPLKPGAHRITVEFVRGSFMARTELTLAAKPGAAYEVRQTNDAQVYGQHTFCEFWIADLATGEKACPPKRVALSKVKP